MSGTSTPPGDPATFDRGPHPAKEQPAVSTSAESTGVADTSSLAGRALRGGMLVVGSKFLLQGFTWASTLLVIRLLEPAAYGIVAAAFFVIGLAQLISPSISFSRPTRGLAARRGSAGRFGFGAALV